MPPRKRQPAEAAAESKSAKPSARRTASPKPEPKRAGGWVDHGDGAGWVLEDKPQLAPATAPEPEPDPATVQRDPIVAGGWVLPADTVPQQDKPDEGSA